MHAFERAHAKAVKADDGQEFACCNAALLLAQLYNLGCVHGTLLYELIRRLVRGFTEADLQMLILILRAVGPTLRQQDPAALKEVILDVQSRSTSLSTATTATTSAAATSAAADADADATADDAAAGGGGAAGATITSGVSVRAQVFIGMLTDLKNNKQRARDQGAADGALPRLRKWLKQLATSSGASEPAPFKARPRPHMHVHGGCTLVRASKCTCMCTLPDAHALVRASKCIVPSSAHACAPSPTRV